VTSPEAAHPRKWIRRLITGASVGLMLLFFYGMNGTLGYPTSVAQREACRRNMDEIGRAIAAYCSSDSQGHFPDNLEALMSKENLSPSVFVCPASHDTPATDPNTLTEGGHLSYTYVGAGLTQDSPYDAVVMFESTPTHEPQGSNVLFAAGQVEFFRSRDVAKITAMAQNGTRPIFWPPHTAAQPSTGP
jgi:hypothetical protein